MAKVRHPLFSGDVSGAFGKKMIFRKGGIVTRMFWPRNPNTAAQQAQRELFKEFSMRGLTQEQADLLYSAIGHLHDDHYAALVHAHDHGDLSGLGDDDHTQYFNQTRGDGRYSLTSHLHDGRYLQSVPQQDHGGLAGLGDDDHGQYYNQTRGDARYLQDAPNDGGAYLRQSAAWVASSASPWTTLFLKPQVTRNNSSVLYAVSGLSFTLTANRQYHVRGRFWYTTNAAADFKFQLKCTSVGNMYTWWHSVAPGATAVVPNNDQNTQPTPAILASVNGYGFVSFESFIDVGASDRAFSFMFAQNTANVSDTSVKAGSYVEYMSS